MNGPNTEFVYDSEVEQTVEKTDLGIKELLQKLESDIETTMRDGDRYGNIENGLLEIDDLILYASRNTEGRTIVDDSVQPPKTERNPYRIHLATTRDDLTVVTVDHDEPADDPDFEEEHVKHWMNEDEGLDLLLNGEYGEVEDFERDGENLILRVYEPYDIGYTKITLSF